MSGCDLLVPAAADDGHLEWTPRLASERPGDIWRPTRRNEGKKLIAILFASKLLRQRQRGTTCEGHLNCDQMHSSNTGCKYL